MEKKIIIFIILITMFSHVQSHAADNNLFSMSMGIAGIGNETALTESRFEYRFQKRFLIFSPLAGMMVFSDGSKYFFTGFNLLGYLGKQLMIAPNFAFGAYHNGGEKELGGVIEFRSGLEIGYQVVKRLMVGVAFHHISNASIYHKNPGTETLSLILTLGRRSSEKKTTNCP